MANLLHYEAENDADHTVDAAFFIHSGSSPVRDNCERVGHPLVWQQPFPMW